jgi:protein gp37
MGSESKIEWTHHTFNPWWGCVRVSPGCERCYAESFAKRTGNKVWGVQSPRRFFGDKYWAEPLKWDRGAAVAGARHRVFCASMADVFEDREDLTPHRDRLWELIRATPNLDWLLLTKRPENFARLGKPDVMARCWVGVTAEDQERADERIPPLISCPAAVRFVSYEPALGLVDLRYAAFNGADSLQSIAGIDWVIVGGESGPGARPFDIGWARSVVQQCREAGVACFVKQLGGNCFAPWKVRWDERLDGRFDAFSPDRVGSRGTNLATVWKNATWHTWDRNGTGGENGYEGTIEEAKRAAIEALQRQHTRPIKGWAQHAHMLKDRKGGDITEWPKDLRVREFPEVANV